MKNNSGSRRLSKYQESIIQTNLHYTDGKGTYGTCVTAGVERHGWVLE